MLFLLSLLISSLVWVFSLIDVVRKPPQLEKFEGGIQNHLVWSIKGECFFVRPHSTETVYLIRVQDCDKK
jgi:hypothetical protein